MAANKHRGEVAFPAAGKQAFIRFTMDDLAELETLFGEEFFGEIERGCDKLSPTKIGNCLSVGLKSRAADGAVSRIWDDSGKAALDDGRFLLKDAVVPIMDALAMSMFGKTYAALIEEAIELRKKQDVADLKHAKEAADEAGVPFDEASLGALSKLLIGMACARSGSGN
jgi:hypothetical protein